MLEQGDLISLYQLISHPRTVLKSKEWASPHRFNWLLRMRKKGIMRIKLLGGWGISFRCFSYFVEPQLVACDACPAGHHHNRVHTLSC